MRSKNFFQTLDFYGVATALEGLKERYNTIIYGKRSIDSSKLNVYKIKNVYQCIEKSNTLELHTDKGILIFL